MCWEKTHIHDFRSLKHTSGFKFKNMETLWTTPIFKKGLACLALELKNWVGVPCIEDTHETSTLDPLSLSKIQIDGCWLVPNITPDTTTKGRPLEIHSDLTNVAVAKIAATNSNMRRYWLTRLKNMGKHQNNMKNTFHGNDHRPWFSQSCIHTENQNSIKLPRYISRKTEGENESV